MFDNFPPRTASETPEPRSTGVAFVAATLSHPPLRLSIDELVEVWTFDVVTASAPRPAEFEDHPDLPIRLRGALGRALTEIPARAFRSGRQRATAFDILFAPVGRAMGGNEIAKPLVVRAEIDRNRFVAEVRLVGWAGCWAPDVEGALAKALLGGIDLKDAGGLRIAIAADHHERHRVEGVSVPTGSVGSMHFRTPVTIRRRSELVLDPRAILHSLPRRIAALACWQGIELVEDWDALSSSIDALVVDDRDLVVHRWQRHSRRMGNVAIPMAGHLGTLRFAGALDRLAPYLALGETCNIGSHAALGLGWYHLALA